MYFYLQKEGVDIIGLKFDKRHEMFNEYCNEAGIEDFRNGVNKAFRTAQSHLGNND